MELEELIRIAAAPDFCDKLAELDRRLKVLRTKELEIDERAKALNRRERLVERREQALRK